MNIARQLAEPLTIDLWPIVEECCICGEPSYHSGIPMLEGMVVPNDWVGKWGGHPACERCRLAQEVLTLPIELHEFRRRILG